MDINVLKAMLTEGLDADTKAKVEAAIDRDAVKSRVATIKAENEYSELATRAQTLQAEMEGDAATGKLGAKAYREWYDKNFSAIQKMQGDVAAYEAKFGKLDAAPPTNNPVTPPTNGRFYSPEELDTMFDTRFQKNFAPRIADVVKTTGKLVQRHLLRGRKTEIDMEKIEDLMTKKGITIEAAYDEWDAPERQKEDKAAEDARVNKRVEEEMQKRQAGANFPAGADMTPGSLAAKSKADVDKFDRTALVHDLAGAWNSVGTKQ